MTDLIRIKSTKSVEMFYDEDSKELYITMVQTVGNFREMVVPMSKVFQVKRGLESAVQRFYRKKKK